MIDARWNNLPKRWVDIVLCMDATGSVAESEKGSSVLDWARHFSARLSSKVYDPIYRVSQCRIRVIVFRDFLADGKNALLSTDFFLLPQQQDALESYLGGISPEGGGDEQEDGLEALALAIRSPWQNDPTLKRQVIILWSDAKPHELGHGKLSSFYPNGMPQSLAELNDWWEDDSVIGQRAKRLVLFAPDEGFWRELSDNWEFTWHFPEALEEEFDDAAFDQLLHMIMRN